MNGLSSAGEIPFLDLGDGYIGCDHLWLFIRLYIYDMCTFLYECYARTSEESKFLSHGSVLGTAFLLKVSKIIFPKFYKNEFSISYPFT